MARLSSVCRPSVCHACIVAKRYEIGPRLLLITNRKFRTLFSHEMKNHLFWMTLKRSVLQQELYRLYAVGIGYML